MRNRSEPDQVTQAGFGLEPIAVTQRVSVATVHQHGADDSGGPAQSGFSQTKDAERRDKMSIRTGKNTESGQDS